jgi:uncharacterized protein involved in tellurium resistance/DNA-directed RNA polymerase subunit L
MEKTKQSAKQFIYDLSSEVSLLTDSYISRFSSRNSKAGYIGNWRQSINIDKPHAEQIAWLVKHPSSNQVDFQINIQTKSDMSAKSNLWIKLKDNLGKLTSKGEIISQIKDSSNNFKETYVAINFKINLLEDALASNEIEGVMADAKKVLELFVNFAGENNIAGIKTKKTKAVLTEVNQEVNSQLSNNFKARLRWFKDIDFDLAALYVLKNGDKGLVYFGNKGSISSSPYINLDKDAMYGGENEKVETLSVINNNHIAKVFIICWDWSNLGGSSAFDRSNVNVAISDNNDNLIVVKPTTASGNDSVCIAEISFNADGIVVKNKSISFKRPGSSASDIYNIIK